jgi:hypothetical protein
MSVMHSWIDHRDNVFDASRFNVVSRQSRGDRRAACDSGQNRAGCPRSYRTDRIFVYVVALFVLTIDVHAVAWADEEPREATESVEHQQAKLAKGKLLLNGKDLSGWQIVDDHDFRRHGAVEIRDGAVLLDEGDPLTGIRYEGKELRRNNYELTWEARRTGGFDFFCGVTFPINKSYCTLILGGWGGGVTGLSNVDGYAANENMTTDYQEFKQNIWYTVRLRVTDRTIQAFVNDQQIVDLDKEDHKFSIWWEQEPLRPLGIATWRTSGAVRDLRIRPINPREEKPSR